MRSFSQHGVVDLYWQLFRVSLNGVVSDLTPGNEFNKISGFVRFLDQEGSKDITVESKADGLAELKEQFELQLKNATGT